MTDIPLLPQHAPGHRNERAGTLIARLPGTCRMPRDFIANGFHRLRNTTGVDADLCFIETDLRGTASLGMMADVRPAKRVWTLPGGHDQGIWTALGRAMLASGCQP